MGHERVCSASKPTRQTPMDPTSPLWNPYPNKGKLIKQNKKLSQASLSCIAMSHSIFLCVGRHYPPAQWVSHYKISLNFCMLHYLSSCSSGHQHYLLIFLSCFFFCFLLFIFGWIHIIREMTGG